MKPIIQRPEDGCDWLYQEREDGGRDFATAVCRPAESLVWLDCTDAEKVAWEKEHNPKEPEDVEPIEETEE